MADLARLVDWPPFKILRDLTATVKAITYVVVVVIGVVVMSIKLGIDRILVTAIMGATTTTAAAVIGFGLGRRRPERCSFEVISQTTIFLVERVDGHHRYTWQKRLEIRSLRNGLRLVPSNWYTTGQTSTVIQPRALYPRQAVFATGWPEEDQAVHRWIYIGRPLADGEVAKVGIEWIYEDDVSPMRPFVTDSAATVTTSLALTLRFPASERPESVEVIQSPTWNLSKQPRRVPGETPKCVTTVADMIDYVVEAKNPKVGTAIGMRWESQ